MDLHVFWFITLGVLLTGYAILDGFDLGVGIVHFTARTDEERRIYLNSIGPLWDGNEVWLVTFGGALFAAFPEAYATIFSGFYTAFMLLLVALIFRAVSMEFRSKQPHRRWRQAFDAMFCVASTLAAFLFGVAVGSVIQGVPVGSDHEYAGNFWHLITPFSLLVGCLVVALFAMHGSFYLHMKTQGELQRRLERTMWVTFALFLALYTVTSIYAVTAIPSATANFARYPSAWLVVGLNVLAVAVLPYMIYRHKTFWAFMSSAAAILALTALFGLAMFPNLLASSLDPQWSLTIYNAASSEMTLKIMRTMAFLGMPFVLAYTAVIYWLFRGKVELGAFSY